MADSASEVEMESDTSSMDGGGSVHTHPRHSQESHVKRIESLSQENRVLHMEIDTLKLKNKSLQAENKELRQTSVNIVSTLDSDDLLCLDGLMHTCKVTLNKGMPVHHKIISL